jgi:hypothetical protein
MIREKIKILFFSVFFLTFFSASMFALNPFITHIYTADPTARVFEGRVYIYASHDKDNAGKAYNKGQFDMEDYHVFSSADMINWVDHGLAFSYKSLTLGSDGNYGWVWAPHGDGDWKDNKPCLWAPDCVYKNGTYYLYYPARDKNVSSSGGSPWAWNQFRIGVATSSSPCGPFVPYTYPAGTTDPYGNTYDPATNVPYEGQSYIPGSYSIDPTVLVDDDGKVYMAFGGVSYGGINGQTITVPPYNIGKGPRIVQLDPVTMATFINAPKEIKIVDKNGAPNDADYYEGPFLFKRYNPGNSTTYYYLQYPDNMGAHGSSGGSEMHYARAEKPTYTDLDDPSIVWKTPTDTTQPYNSSTNTNKILPYVGQGMTIHGSQVEFKGDWYVFYHNKELSGGNNRRRSICVERMNFNSDGTIQESSFTAQGMGTSAYYTIKAQFCSLSGVDTTSDNNGSYVGKCVINIHNGDSVSINNVNFGSIGSNVFVAQAASNTNGGTIEIYMDGTGSSNMIGSVKVTKTNDWYNWNQFTCNLVSNAQNITKGVHNITLKFINTEGVSGGMFNLDWFKFIRAENIPVGNLISLKTLNPNCVPNGGGTAGQQYLSTRTTGTVVYWNADAPAIAKENQKFSLLDLIGASGSTVQFNSASNGKNMCDNGTSYLRMISNGGNYKSLGSKDSFLFDNNYDGTISFFNVINGKYMSIDTTLGTNPASAYINKATITGSSEKYYCEVQDAPIGCIVAFKSLNADCLDNKGQNAGQKYLCIDDDQSGQLCANRTVVTGDWEKFVVTDANNGYISLRSYNKNQYLRFFNSSDPGKTNDSLSNDNSGRFQWKNNGDGTISLFNVGVGKYLSVNTWGVGKNNPGKVTASQDTINSNWEKFYCQITARPKKHFRNENTSKILSVHDHSDEVLDQENHFSDPAVDFWLSQSWIIEAVTNDYVRIKNEWKGNYLTAARNDQNYTLVQDQNLDDNNLLQRWAMEKTNDGRVRLKNIGTGTYLTETNNKNDDGIIQIACQPLHKSNSGQPDWASQLWINE